MLYCKKFRTPSPNLPGLFGASYIHGHPNNTAITCVYGVKPPFGGRKFPLFTMRFQIRGASWGKYYILGLSIVIVRWRYLAKISGGRQNDFFIDLKMIPQISAIGLGHIVVNQGVGWPWLGRGQIVRREKSKREPLVETPFMYLNSPFCGGENTEP